MSVSSFNIGCQYTGAFARVALALLMALCCSAVLAAGLDTVLGRSTQEVSVQRLTDVEADATATSLFKRWTDLSATAPRYGVSEGFSKQPVWLRATIIRPEAAKETWWLVFSNALLDRIEIFLQRPDGSQVKYLAGEDFASLDGAMSTLLPSALLHLGAGENRLLIRVQTRNAMATRIVLRDDRSMLLFEHRELFQGGLLAGTHLITALAGLLIALALRERVWMLFSVFVLVSGTSLMFMLGLPGWLGLREFPGLSDKIHGAVLVFTVAAVIDFVARLTRTHLEYPRAYRTLARSGWLLAIPAGVLVFLGYFTEIILQLQFVILIVVPALVVMLWRQWRQGVEAAGFFLLGVGSYICMSLLRVLRNLGVLPSAWWTEGLHEMMSIGYLTVLAFGIATLSARALTRREALEAELMAERTARNAERDFLAMLSHELRTPLATIETSTRLLQDVPGLDSTLRAIRHEKIARAVARLRDLFDRLLASDRLRSDWHLTEPAPVDLVSLIQTVCESSLADRPAADLQFEAPAGPAVVEADRELIGIALRNLVANALVYGPQDCPVQLALRPVTQGWRLEVHDLGSAIPLSERESIFGPYVRGPGASSTPGAGLGLFIVRRIARLHGGEAGLDCPPAGGNRFWIEIPTTPVPERRKQ